MRCEEELHRRLTPDGRARSARGGVPVSKRIYPVLMEWKATLEVCLGDEVNLHVCFAGSLVV